MISAEFAQVGLCGLNRRSFLGASEKLQLEEMNLL